MSTDLFGMAVENRRSIPELIIVGSQRIEYYPLLEAARNFTKPLIFDNVHLISLDKSLINGLLVCKHCHMLFTDTRSNRPVFIKHLAKFHGIARKERKPKPTNNPIQFTETPITIYLMEPDKELKMTGKDNTDIGNLNVLGPQMDMQSAAQAKTPEAADADTSLVTCPSTQSVRGSHLKKERNQVSASTTASPTMCGYYL